MKTHVLLAVDQDHLKESLRNILELEDWIEVVGVANNEQTLLEMTEKYSPEVVVIDFDFKTDGIKLGEKIHKVRPLSKIIMLSIYDYVGKVKVKKITPEEVEIAKSFNWISKKSSPYALIKSIEQTRVSRRPN